MTTKARTFRELLQSARPLVSPGVYDGYSARLVEQMRYKTAATTGAGLSNAVLGQPDIGIMSLLENVNACRPIARGVAIPMMADADTGYGNAVTVFHTVQYFEEAGIVGINIEDQVWPKPCGAMRGKDVILPYSLQTNDVPAYFDMKVSAPEFEAMSKRQFDVLYRDSEHSGRVMAIAVHPFVTGQPHRVVALERALDYICGHEGVWRAPGWEIVQHYLASDFARTV